MWVRRGDQLVAQSDLQTASGFCAQAPQELHFGLDGQQTYTVEVRFPSGARRLVEDVKPGQVLTIEEPGELATR